jgi:amino acid permease
MSSRNLGTLTSWTPLGHSRPVTGLLYLFFIYIIVVIYINNMGTAVAQWLRYCATNQKVAGSIPDGVIGIFIDIILLIALWP